MYATIYQLFGFNQISIIDTGTVNFISSITIQLHNMSQVNENTVNTSNFHTKLTDLYFTG